MIGLTFRFLLQVQYACKRIGDSLGVDPSLMVSTLTCIVPQYFAFDLHVLNCSPLLGPHFAIVLRQRRLISSLSVCLGVVSPLVLS
jgi:hypothetical protein